MSSRNSRVRALVLAAAVLLPALPARALPLDGPSRVRDDRGALTVLFDGLRSFWHGLIDRHSTAGVGMKEGMSIDPNGHPAGSGANSGNPDEGITIDPHG